MIEFLCLIAVVIKLTQAQAVISGGGSTFSAPAFSSAIKEFNDLYSASLKSIVYTPTDSATGMRSTFSGLYNFGGTDIAINIPPANGSYIVAIPVIAGGIINSYNLPGITQNVKLSRTVLPRIYDGTITQWNDPALLTDNPFLENIAKPITVVVRSAGSGASQNLVRGLGLMDLSTGYSTSPYLKPGFKLSIKNSILAATTASAAIIVGSVAYTFTYLNQLEADELESISQSTTTTALIQHLNGDYIGWSLDTGALAVSNINVSSVYNLDEKSQALNVMDVSVPGAYPWTIISNVAINPNNISSDYTSALWTLRFLWFFVTHPTFATKNGFVSVFNTTIGNHALHFLSDIAVNGHTLYGQSVCDPQVDLTYKSPCRHGSCTHSYAFQEPSIQCVCEFGYQNINQGTCIEPAPFFIPGTITKIQLILFGTGVILLVILIIIVFNSRNQPTIKAMSPLCCINILAGCLLGVVTIILEAATETTLICYTKVIIPSLAFGMVFSMIFLKGFRIFLIFGYPRIARSRFIRDDFLIAVSNVVAIVDGILAWIYVQGGQITSKLTHFTDTELQVYTCLPKPESEGTATTLMGVHFGFNALILAMCLYIGQLTRKSASKFDESKQVGATIYVSCAAVLLAMGINFGVIADTSGIFNLHRITASIAIWLICIVSPMILFVPALRANIESEKSRLSVTNRVGTGSAASSHNDRDDGQVLTFMFHTGMRPNRATALWKSAVMMIMPEIDMLIVLAEQYSGTYIFSECNIKVVEKTTVAAKKQAEESVELTVGANKTVFVVEFPHKERMEEFRGLRTQATLLKKRESDSGKASSANSAVPGKSERTLPGPPRAQRPLSTVLAPQSDKGTWSEASQS
ncbi:UNVERIFIED_CONTAM: hypothetical protein HDU68_006475 [Siphonaria sp. JEL0065]|nr:hypothetical protein HDU68_006475 [Siphonaria sp. JEL0065]